MTVTPKLEFKARGRVDVNQAARRLIFDSLCGGYRVVKSRILYGGRTRDCRYPEVWRSERWCQYGTQFGWATIGTHRTRGSAEKACQQQARMWGFATPSAAKEPAHA